MGLWNDVSSIFSGGGREDMNEAYDEANQYMRPYQQGGVEDYQKYRAYADQFGNKYAPYQDAGKRMYDRINQSPNAYYDEIMGDYSESPEAKYEQEQAMRAANAGASASGMSGSGAYQKAIQQNAADIAARDRQRYFGNVMGVDQAQMGYLNNLQGQEDKYNMMQQYLTNLGYGAGTAISGNEVNRGLSNARYDQSAFDQIAGLAGFGGQNLKNYWNSTNPGIPPYMRNEMDRTAPVML